MEGSCVPKHANLGVSCMPASFVTYQVDPGLPSALGQITRPPYAPTPSTPQHQSKTLGLLYHLCYLSDILIDYCHFSEWSHLCTAIHQGWRFCGFFRICEFFFQCFQSSAFLRISAVSSFPHSNQRERNAEKKCLENNLNRASERNAEKLHTKNIPNTSDRASAPRTSEL